jgi:hypothetical protein
MGEKRRRREEEKKRKEKKKKTAAMMTNKVVTFGNTMNLCCLLVTAPCNRYCVVDNPFFLSLSLIVW